jgi:dethiobiotin synthetase
VKGIIVAGIGTDVGKTVVAAVLCEALGADYWKPIQSGTDDMPADAVTVGSLLTDGAHRVHPSTYSFRKSLSPHAAARYEDTEVSLAALVLPNVDRPLVIELAGGILVPINDRETNLDLITKLSLPVVLVSRHYLGSINHTLLSCEVLKAHGIRIAGIVFNGDETLPETERIIAALSKVPVLARIPSLAHVSSNAIADVAKHLTGLAL